MFQQSPSSVLERPNGSLRNSIQLLCVRGRDPKLNALSLQVCLHRLIDEFAPTVTEDESNATLTFSLDLAQS
jgi:hypothetical protein